MQDGFKLVRDNVPNIVMSKGETVETAILQDRTDVRREALRVKLQEELAELIDDSQRNVHQSAIANECGDLVEVTMRLAELHGLTENQVSEARKKKAGTHGTFEKMICMRVNNDLPKAKAKESETCGQPIESPEDLNPPAP